MSFSFYIWYRVARDDAETEHVVRGMMARLGCRTGTPGRLLKKDGEPVLWLEVYEGVSNQAEFRARLHQAVDEFDVEMFIDGSRHTECFLSDDPIPLSCAAVGGEGRGRGQER